MEFVRCDIREVERTRRTNKLQKMLTDFYESDMDAARVNFSREGYKKPTYCVTAIRAAIKRSQLYGIACVQRGDAVYLLKKGSLDKHEE